LKKLSSGDSESGDGIVTVASTLRAGAKRFGGVWVVRLGRAPRKQPARRCRGCNEPKAAETVFVEGE
jgi:hypothetical protein